MGARISFPNGFVSTMKQIVELESRGFLRKQIAPTVGLTPDRVTRAMRIYLTSLGETADSGRIEVRNKAVELVKQLDADEIPLSTAERQLVVTIKQFGGKPINRKAASAHDPERQLDGYLSAIGALEGMCFALDKLPDVVHSSINTTQRKELEERLASCRRIIERRINIIRRDTNVECHP